MRNFKRMLAVLSAVTIAAGSVAYAAYDRGDKVTLIVEVTGDAVLETQNAIDMGIELFCETDEAETKEQNVRMTQAEVQSEIKERVDSKAQAVYTYTHVFNGFSVEAYENDIEKIKALPDVKNVYISRTYEISDDTEQQSTVYTENGCALTHLTDMHDEGYTGEGKIIAIIDNGFDVSHEMFQGNISNPRLSRENISEIINNEGLSINRQGGYVTVNRVYRSEKIPYAYNYYNKNSDTFNLSSSHGTHVAGIAAGNNGTDQSGGKFVGAAPDAQLLLMACNYLTSEAILAAIDDSVKLGADIINASYGAEYEELDETLEKAINTAVNAGVMFSAAAGNSARGYEGGAINAANIDYGTSGTPAYITAATSVANAYARKAQNDNYNITMSGSSSWGVSSSLELKPEITAPGSNIYSSVNNDRYNRLTGTSMAAPHMTGAAVLMDGYIDKNKSKFQDVTNKAKLIENLIMTSADVIMQDSENSIPYSPRLQGAGIINLEKAVNTPVTLIGNGEKSKLSLGEVKDEFEFEFTAKNYGSSNITYDNIRVEVITDSADDKGVIGDMKKLGFEAETPQEITVGACSDETVNVKIKLDKEEISENLETFVNGFFVDGYIFLASSLSEVPEISIPFTGFYGDWSKAPSLKEPIYEGDSIPGDTYMSSLTKRKVNGLIATQQVRTALGANLFVSTGSEDYYDYFSKDFIGISPNTDGEYDNVAAIAVPLRQLGKTDIALYGSDGALIAEKTDMSSSGEIYYAPKFTPTYLYFDDEVTDALPDGDYTFEIKAGFYAQQSYEQNESVQIPFYIDREKPEITKFETRVDGNSTYLDVAAADNRHLMGFIVSGTKNDSTFREVYPIKGLTEAEHSFDITGADMDSLSLETVDYALNSAKRSSLGLDIGFGGVSGENYIFTVSNTTGKEIEAAVTAALYRDDMLVAIRSKNDTIPTGNGYEIFNMPNVGYNRIKVFVWNSLEDMKPLYEAFEF